MTCGEVRPLLAEAALGEDQAKAIAARHAETCATCADELSALASTIALVRRARPEMPFSGPLSGVPLPPARRSGLGLALPLVALALVAGALVATAAVLVHTSAAPATETPRVQPIAPPEVVAPERSTREPTGLREPTPLRELEIPFGVTAMDLDPTVEAGAPDLATASEDQLERLSRGLATLDCPPLDGASLEDDPLLESEATPLPFDIEQLDAVALDRALERLSTR